MLRNFVLLLVAASVSACASPDHKRLEETTRPTYDQKTGKLKELTYDANANGRIDTWTEMDGPRPLRSRIDRNEDGKIDRWEYYDADGRLVKVGFSRAGSGTADAWAFSGAGGKVERIEISATAEEQRITRREYYDPTQSGRDGHGALVRAEEDADGDGRADKWETYENGALKTVAFDEDEDGKADRRLTYGQAALLLVESDPDPSGRFRSRVAVQ